MADCRPPAEQVTTDNVTTLEHAITNARPPVEQETADNITVLEPTIAHAGLSSELPPTQPSVEPLDELENPKVRTKLRIYAILVALYVHYPLLVFSELQLANNTSSSSSSS